MSAIIWADVTAIAPELSTVSDDAQDSILAHVNTALAVDIFGGESAPKTRLARIYLAAHLGSASRTGSSGASGAAGPVVSESAGGLSRSYANLTSASGTGGLSSSTYGQLFEALVGSTPARCPVVV